MDIIRDKNKPIELPEEVILEKLESDDLTKKERRKLKRELTKTKIRKILHPEERRNI